MYEFAFQALLVLFFGFFLIKEMCSLWWLLVSLNVCEILLQQANSSINSQTICGRRTFTVIFHAHAHPLLGALYVHRALCCAHCHVFVPIEGRTIANHILFSCIFTTMIMKLKGKNDRNFPLLRIDWMYFSQRSLRSVWFIHFHSHSHHAVYDSDTHISCWMFTNWTKIK